MRTNTDYYDTLAVPEAASQERIRRAYLRKARQSHPDLHPEDPEAQSEMTAINEAYDTLSDERRRADYDARRNIVVVHVPDYEPSPIDISYSRRARKRPPSVIEEAVSVFTRLVRFVVANLAI